MSEFQDVNPLVENARSVVVITNDLQCDRAMGILASVRAAMREVEKQRKHLKEPILESGRRIDKEAKKLLDPLEREESNIARMIETYATAKRVREAAEREKERLRLEQEAAALQAEAVAMLVNAGSDDEVQAAIDLADAGTEAVAMVKTAIAKGSDIKTDAGSTRKVYQYELVDITKVPEEYLVPPEERLARGKLFALERAGAPIDIPGMRKVEGTSIRTR